jgi:hypothetical protein
MLNTGLYQQHHYGLHSDQITEFPPHSIAALQSITESWIRVVTTTPNSYREQFGTGMEVVCRERPEFLYRYSSRSAQNSVPVR